MTATETLKEIQEYCESKKRSSSVARSILKQWFSPFGVNVRAPIGPFTEMNGLGVKPHGIYYGAWHQSANEPKVFRNLHVHDHSVDNARLMLWENGEAQPTPSMEHALIEDCIFENASANPPKSRNGTAESNLWIGMHTFVDRVICRNGAWMGVWIGGTGPTKFHGAYGSHLSNLQVLDQDIGIYFEHVSFGVVVENFLVRARNIGVNVEWWYTEPGTSEPRGSADCTLRNFDISVTGNPDNWSDREGWGISLDAGVYGYQIGPGVIRGGKGIELPRKLYKGNPNMVVDVVRPDGSPVPVVYHDRPIG